MYRRHLVIANAVSQSLAGLPCAFAARPMRARDEAKRFTIPGEGSSSA